MASDVEAALDKFVSQLIRLQPEAPTLPFNSEWPSDCYESSASDGQPVRWRPTRQTLKTDLFERIENALDEKVHPDIADYYSRYWSDPLPANCVEGDLSLIQVWNEEDMERLRGNLIGHALSKRQQKRPLTFFFACAEPDDNYFISVDNFSGEVLLELPGKPPIRKLANNLAEFIGSLTPRAIENMD